MINNALPDQEIADKVAAMTNEELDRRLEHVAHLNLSGRSWENAGPYRTYVGELITQERYLHAEKATRAASVNGGGI